MRYVSPVSLRIAQNAPVRPLLRVPSLGDLPPEEGGDSPHRVVVLRYISEEAVVAAAVEVNCLNRFSGLTQRVLEGPRAVDLRQVGGAIGWVTVFRTMQQQERRADLPGTFNHKLRVPRRVEHGGPHAAPLAYVMKRSAAAARMPEEGDAVAAHSRKVLRRSDERADAIERFIARSPRHRGRAWAFARRSAARGTPAPPRGPCQLRRTSTNSAPAYTDVYKVSS